MAMVAVGGCDGFAALRLFTPVFRKIDQKTCSVQVRRSALIASLNKRLCCTESGCDIYYNWYTQTKECISSTKVKSHGTSLGSAFSEQSNVVNGELPPSVKYYYMLYRESRDVHFASDRPS